MTHASGGVRISLLWIQTTCVLTSMIMRVARWVAGPGIQSAQFVASKGAKAVLTGNVGPNAVSALSAAGVQLVTGLTGTVRQSVDDYKRGRLKSSAEANVSDNYGMDGGVGRIGGMGQGRGMGGGMGTGRGMDRGGGRGGGMRGGRQIRKR